VPLIERKLIHVACLTHQPRHNLSPLNRVLRKPDLRVRGWGFFGIRAHVEHNMTTYSGHSLSSDNHRLSSPRSQKPPLNETVACSHNTIRADCIMGLGLLTARRLRHITSPLSSCPARAENGQGAQLLQGTMIREVMVRFLRFMAI